MGPRAGPTFSRRTAWNRVPNALALRREALEARGVEVLDLTESNPTRCGLELPEREIGAALAAAPLRPYLPEPLGAWPAREAVAQFLERRGRSVSAASVVLTASTSEAFSRLFQLLCDPGDNVLVPQPSYPLFESLATLDGIETRPYALELATDFGLERANLLAAADARTRAVVWVNPQSPTGVFLRRHELETVESLCVERGWALICDEVFADSGVGVQADRVLSLAAEPGLGMLTFSLGGLSKSLALPQLKLAWMAVLGPEALQREALARLELICDSYLSVNGPLQSALPALLGLAPGIQRTLLERLATNEATLRAALPADSPWSLRPREGGWTAVLRGPATDSEEALCLELLKAGVWVHPGHFYDFPKGRFLVLSLLLSPVDFAEGTRRLAETLFARKEN